MRMTILVAALPIATLSSCNGDQAASTTSPAASSATAALSASMPAEEPAEEPTADGRAEVKQSEPIASPAPPAVESPIPDIPEGRSTPPTALEWQNAEPINTQEAHSKAENCEMKLVREWLKVYCYGDIVEHADLSGVGQKHRDYFVAVRRGKSADLVVRLRKGQTTKATVIRKDAREAVLYVSWPESKAKPVHVALGRGKPPKKEVDDPDDKPKRTAKPGKKKK